MPFDALPTLAHLDDDALVALTRVKQPFEALIQRYNGRPYRVARLLSKVRRSKADTVGRFAPMPVI